MSREEIFESLKEILHTVKPAVDINSISMNSTLVYDLGIDSLSILLLSIAIETKFGFRFDGVPEFSTVGDVVEFISGRTA